METLSFASRSPVEDAARCGAVIAASASDETGQQCSNIIQILRVIGITVTANIPGNFTDIYKLVTECFLEPYVNNTWRLERSVRKKAFFVSEPLIHLLRYLQLHHTPSNIHFPLAFFRTFSLLYSLRMLFIRL
ncbi:hypothetical protein J6590_051108 [Homalodisca vitripennis]|nr:hypothetical protein J6590_051108 [Homalodisca vitripennis]